MVFQFLCPQGHLLQGEEAHMGMQCQCPQCGTAFIIPTVDRPAQPNSGAVVSPAPGRDELADPLSDASLGDAGSLADLSGLDHDDAADAAAQFGDGQLDGSQLAVSELGAAAAAEEVLHIPCPNGHELETPLDMIGQRARCPQCGAEFRLKRERSIEYLHKQEILDRKRAKFWFQLAVTAACFVVLVLLVMIILVTFSSS